MGILLIVGFINVGKERMSGQLLEEKHRFLERVLHENIEKKHSLEVAITEEFEELKRLEVSLEKMHATHK